jgi:hypothetical protein
MTSERPMLLEGIADFVDWNTRGRTVLVLTDVTFRVDFGPWPKGTHVARLVMDLMQGTLQQDGRPPGPSCDVRLAVSAATDVRLAPRVLDQLRHAGRVVLKDVDSYLDIKTSADLQLRRQQLTALPEDWYVDHDGSHAARPTAEAIDRGCGVAEQALTRGLTVDYVDPDAMGGIYVRLSSASSVSKGRHVDLVFRNGGAASVLACSDLDWPTVQWSTSFDRSWSAIEEFLR